MPSIIHCRDAVLHAWLTDPKLKFPNTYWQTGKPKNHLQSGSRGPHPNHYGLAYHHLYIITSFQIWFGWFYDTEWWRNGSMNVFLLWCSGGDCVVKGWGLGMRLTFKNVLFWNLMTSLRSWRGTLYDCDYGKHNWAWIWHIEPTRCTLFLINLFQLNYPLHVSNK